MNLNPVLLRRLAEAKENLTDMQGRALDITKAEPGSIRVSVDWVNGSLLSGHAALVRSVREMVSERIADLVKEAVARQQAVVDSLVSELTGGE